MNNIYKNIILATFLFISNTSFGQSGYAISLENIEIVDFKQREFFINNVIDRYKNEVFAYSKLGESEQINALGYDTNLQSEVKYLLLKSLPEKKNQIGLTLIIDKLSSTENYGKNGDEVKITFQAKLVFEDEVLYTNRYEKVFSDVNSYQEYPSLIGQTIQGFIYEFARVAEPENVAPLIKTPADEEINHEDKNESILQESKSRDVVAVGYQIGGFSLIGVDYEFRASDNIGIHAGIGFIGFTAGVKIHWKPTKDSGFINVSYKDGGFGLMNGWAVEYGSRKAFGKNEGGFGFHYQVGLALITNLSPDYRKAFGGVTPPFPSISVGIGFSW